MSQIKNLKGKGKATQFKKGNNANPKGRPKGAKNAKTIIKELFNAVSQTIELDEVRELVGSDKVTNQEVMFAALLKKAMSGSVTHARELLDRLDGKATNYIATPTDEKIKIEIELPPEIDFNRED